MGVIEIAESLITNGQFDDAKIILNQFLEDEPDNNEAICLMGIALTEIGENDRAIKALNFCLRNNEYNAAAWEALGCAWLRKNDYVQAKEALENALRFEPETGQYYETSEYFQFLKEIIKKHVSCLNLHYRKTVMIINHFMLLYMSVLILKIMKLPKDL